MGRAGVQILAKPWKLTHTLWWAHLSGLLWRWKWTGMEAPGLLPWAPWRMGWGEGGMTNGFMIVRIGNRHHHHSRSTGAPSCLWTILLRSQNAGLDEPLVQCIMSVFLVLFRLCPHPRLVAWLAGCCISAETGQCCVSACVCLPALSRVGKG